MSEDVVLHIHACQMSERLWFMYYASTAQELFPSDGYNNSIHFNSPGVPKSLSNLHLDLQVKLKMMMMSSSSKDIISCDYYVMSCDDHVTALSEWIAMLSL